MEIVKNYKWRLILTLFVLIGLAFVYRLYHRDVQALKDFSVAYNKFEKVISDFSRPLFAPNLEGARAADELERKAEEALTELKTKASARISSLIKNDGDLMDITREIADFSEKELEALKAYQRGAADKNADLDRFAKELGDLTCERQTAYARFRELAGLKD
jgi:hypothetical protein